MRNVNVNELKNQQSCQTSVSGSTSDKDWTGNKNSIFKTLGASSHTEKEREENDFYATDPKAVELLLDLEDFSNGVIWECACGEGHLSKAIINKGLKCYSSDLIDRGFEKADVIDFLNYDSDWFGNIITNPPYKYASEFIEKSMNIIHNGFKVAMFLKIQFLEGKARKKLFTKYPPKKIYVSSSRLLCAKNADFDGMKAGGGSAVAYAWFIWEKGFKGQTTIDWFN